ncbi:MAG: hypothetical protein ACRD6X_01625 [Pyrinomonadaceae bacterium]
MNQPSVGVVLKRFESPDETRAFIKGRFEIVRLGGMTIGRATYEPGWKWSEHVGPGVGASRCSVEHVGMVLSGSATAAFDDGTVVEMKAGEVFYIPPTPHDSLGRWRSSLRISALSWRRPLREEMMPNKALQRTVLPPLRSGRPAAELGR